jgi:hypothetical protein
MSTQSAAAAAQSLAGSTWALTQHVHGQEPGMLTVTFNANETLTATDPQGNTLHGKWHQWNFLGALAFNIDNEANADLTYLGNVLGPSMGGWVNRGLIPIGIWSGAARTS